GLISLFTHMHIFWIIGLVLAFIELPDFSTPLNRIAGSAEKMAGYKPGEGFVDLPSAAEELERYREQEAGKAAAADDKPPDGAVPLPARADAHAKQRERAHA